MLCKGLLDFSSEEKPISLQGQVGIKGQLQGTLQTSDLPRHVNIVND